MKKLALLSILSAAFCFADSITKTGVVTAVIGTAAAPVASCVLSTDANPGELLVKFQEGTNAPITMTVPIPIGTASAFTGAWTIQGQTIVWTVQQPTAGVMTYQVSAGTAPMQQGNF